MENNTVSILGCGWAGYPLAKLLLKKGYLIKGSTSSDTKLAEMEQDGIDPFLVQLTPHINSNKTGFFNSEVLIVTIPPKNDPNLYARQIADIIRNIHEHGIKKVIYFSSTSVYGNPRKTVDESSSTQPETPSGEAVRLAEEMLLADPRFSTTIIRFGGLVGPGRHPGKFLAGKKDIKNGLAPVNLIHLDDCTGIILSILEHNFSGKIINACSPDHPTRKEYYTMAAKAAGLSEPQFIDELDEWKIVESIYVSKLLDYQFKIKNWTSWLLSKQIN